MSEKCLLLLWRFVDYERKCFHSSHHVSCQREKMRSTANLSHIRSRWATFCLSVYRNMICLYAPLTRAHCFLLCADEHARHFPHKIHTNSSDVKQQQQRRPRKMSDAAKLSLWEKFSSDLLSRLVTWHISISHGLRCRSSLSWLKSQNLTRKLLTRPSMVFQPFQAAEHRCSISIEPARLLLCERINLTRLHAKHGR